MKLRTLGLAALAVALSIGAANAVTVHRSVVVKGAPWWVWLDIGGFCEIEDWHPAVKDCDDHWKDGMLTRTLSLVGGGTIVEKRTAKAKGTYSYEIVSSPLPVRHYRSTLKVSAVPGGTKVEWWGTFQPKHGSTKAQAAAVIAGIYEAGLNKIAADHH